jgi:hypothetical protein
MVAALMEQPTNDHKYKGLNLGKKWREELFKKLCRRTEKKRWRMKRNNFIEKLKLYFPGKRKTKR